MNIEERLAWLEELAAQHGWAVPKKEAYPDKERQPMTAREILRQMYVLGEVPAQYQRVVEEWALLDGQQ